MINRLLFSSLLLLSLIGLACNTSKTAATAPVTAAPTLSAYAGTWAVSVAETPLGNVTGDMLLTETAGGALGGIFTAEGTSYPLEYVKLTDRGFETSFYLPDYGTNVPMVLTGDPAAGSLMGMTMGEYTTTARRK